MIHLNKWIEVFTATLGNITDQNLRSRVPTPTVSERFPAICSVNYTVTCSCVQYGHTYLLDEYLLLWGKSLLKTFNLDMCHEFPVRLVKQLARFTWNWKQKNPCTTRHNGHWRNIPSYPELHSFSTTRKYKKMFYNKRHKLFFSKFKQKRRNNWLQTPCWDQYPGNPGYTQKCNQ